VVAKIEANERRNQKQIANSIGFFNLPGRLMGTGGYGPRPIRQ
jgi:hypothetical protein